LMLFASLFLLPALLYVLEKSRKKESTLKIGQKPAIPIENN